MIEFSSSFFFFFLQQPTTTSISLLARLSPVAPPSSLFQSPLSPHSITMFKLMTLLVLVIALIAGAFADEERAAVAAAAPALAPRRAGPPSPSAAPAAASNAVSFSLSFPFSKFAVLFVFPIVHERERRQGPRETRLAARDRALRSEGK